MLVSNANAIVTRYHRHAAYMAPSRCSPRSESIRGCIYALGTIAYLMLGGRRPFGDMMQLVMQKIMTSRRRSRHPFGHTADVEKVIIEFARDRSERQPVDHRRI